MKTDGFPEDLVKILIEDLKTEKRKGLAEVGKKHISYGLISIVLGIALFMGGFIFFSIIGTIPLGLIIVGIIFLLHGLYKKKASKAPLR